MLIVIAGASRGIGKYLAQELSLLGHTVYGTYNKTVPDHQNNVRMVKVDLTHEDQTQNWIKEIPWADHDKIALIHCVGENYNMSIHKSDTNMWFDTIKTNLLSAYLTIKHILPIMKSKSFGRIVLLSSVVPNLGIAGTSAYSASKSALWGLARTVAAETAKSGITVNTINLGYFDIGMISDVPNELLESIVKRIPMGKLGALDSILSTVNYLLSTEYLTGSQINLNGGL